MADRKMSIRWITFGAFLLTLGGAAYSALRREPASTEAVIRAEDDAVNTAKPTRETVIPVEGMSCAACAARVTRTLKELDGVEDSEVSLANRNVKVRHDRKVTMEKLIMSINALGYEATAPAGFDAGNAVKDGQK